MTEPNEKKPELDEVASPRLKDGRLFSEYVDALVKDFLVALNHEAELAAPKQ